MTLANQPTNKDISRRDFTAKPILAGLHHEYRLEPLAT
jgi:hypothetical protein